MGLFESCFEKLFNSLSSVTTWRVLFSLLLGVLCYLSFKSNPAIQEVGWMPGSLAELSDIYDQWKNFVGFLAMGITGFILWPLGVGPTAAVLKHRRVLLALLLCGIIVVIELIQVPIPTRWCDPKDILAGSAGVLTSWPLAVGFQGMLAKWSGKSDTR